MPIDPYSPCPGGTGKKIKFCCSDLVAELEKVQRMLEGEQRAACLEHVEALEARYPERACLLSIKAMLQAQLGQQQQAHATLGAFRAKYPGNPVALAEQATLEASTAGGVAGVRLLQDALENCREQVPAQVYDAIGLVAQVLIAEGHLIAGRAHLVLQLGMSGTSDRRPLELLMRLNSSSSLPLLAKQDLPLAGAPDDALWKNAFVQALEPATRGAWRLAADQLVALAAQVGDWPAIWHNVAVLRTWLADTAAAVEAWRKYAAQEIPFEDAVEAEALAQSLDPDAMDMVDVLSIEYAVNDLEVLQARLAANRRALPMPVELARMGSDDEPPPRGAYWLLNRPVEEGGAALKAADVPQVVGQAFVFGKQTDRPARLELTTYRTQRQQAAASLAEIANDALGAPGPEEVTTEVPVLQHALSISWRFPDDVSPEARRSLVAEQRQDLLANRWPDMPQQALGGHTPRQVAGKPEWQIRLGAAILLLELATDRVAPEFDYNGLRRALGSPELGPIDPSQVSLAALPLVRLARVDIPKLSDEALVDLYRRADHYRHITALRGLAHELIARPAINEQVEKAEVYGALAQLETDPRQAGAYLDAARQAAESAGKSTAPWDLAELAMRISTGDVAQTDRLLHHIRDEHIKEPGVAQALFELLVEAGIVGPDGKPTAAPAAEAPGVVVSGGESGAKIWTPDGGQPSGKKSTLWTPGD